MKEFQTGKVKGKYSPEVRSFALTLHFYSPRAYEYVRGVCKNRLPAPRTLRSWYASVDGGPGCTSESLVAIKLKVDEALAKNKKIVCNLVMDEMAIRKHIHYDHIQKKYHGYVDFGNSYENENVEKDIAKEALVFLINAVNDRWKIPVAYFLVDGLNSTEKTDILREVLIFISQVDVTICSVTFDGATSNFAMCKKLGSSMDPINMKTYFKHPITNQKVYLFLDICHMLKLIRNTMASKYLCDGDGNNIMWKYIDNLEKLQAADGVLQANNLVANHVRFQNQKMKTKLAAQTLSCSVAASLQYLQTACHPDFIACGPTIKFIETFNILFDIFNSKNKFGKRFKKPLSINSAEEIFKYFDEASNYIEQLQVKQRSCNKNILQSQSKSGFLGFLIAINNFKAMYLDLLLEKKSVEYFTGYKFSQDHIESFFSKIRSRGGFNKNPTALQFTSAYKRLIIHNEIKTSVNANCINYDSTKILTIPSSSNYQPWKNRDAQIEVSLLDSSNTDEFDEIDLKHISPAIHDTVTYIAGFVEKKLKE